MQYARIGMLAAVGSMALATCAAQSRAPVLVELFTSEGCSSCPPADRLLEKLDPQVIVLSEHVDYWDHQGWRDRFSSPATTARQRAYSRIMSLPDIYTPQMVVDGEREFTGNDAPKALESIAVAERRKKAVVHLERSPAGLQVDADQAPSAADVYLALADDTAESQVGAGENAGHKLHHVAVLRKLEKLGSVKRGAAFHRLVELPRGSEAQRLIVFLQEPGPGRVSGAAMLDPAGAR